MDVTRFVQLFVLLISTVFAAGSVHAASMSYNLNLSNEMPDGVDYLTVTISDGTDVSGEVGFGDIDISVVVNKENFPFLTPEDNFGIQNFSFNYNNLLTVGVSNIVDIDPSTWMITEDANAGGGFGKFEFQLSGTGMSRTELLAFSIRNVDGDNIGDYAMGSSVKSNPADEFFASHVAGFDAGGGLKSAQFAGSTVVPVPAAVWLFGSGLLCLAGIARRRAR